MMKAVRNSASEIITEFGGAVCKPMAVRKSESTTTMRVKLVTITKMDGASASTVIKAINWMARSVSVVSSPKSIEISWANVTSGKKASDTAASTATRPRQACLRQRKLEKEVLLPRLTVLREMVIPRFDAWLSGLWLNLEGGSFT